MVVLSALSVLIASLVVLTGRIVCIDLLRRLAAVSAFGVFVVDCDGQVIVQEGLSVGWSWSGCATVRLLPSYAVP
jgi:hypothetical protein